MADNAKWYVAHTYSGYENAVKTAIEKFVANRHLEDMILDIQIPLETVTEVTDSGETKEVERKVFPGYVLVKMIMTDDTWHLIRNIRGVTGFVGTANNEPIPLTEEEVLALGMERREIVAFVLPRHGRRDRRREEQGVRGRVHVRTRNAGRAGARSGRGRRTVITAKSDEPRMRQTWERRSVSPRAAGIAGRYHIQY